MHSLLITHSPSFDDYELLTAHIKTQDEEVHHVLVHGGCRIVADFCKAKGFKMVLHKPDFKGWGEMAVKMAYEQAAKQCQYFIFFWDGHTTDWEHVLRDRFKMTKRVQYKSLKDMLVEEKKQVKRKKITVPLSESAKKRYLEAHQIWYQREYPQAYKDGFYSKPKILPINSGARMDSFIVNFIVWSGLSATKVTVMQKRDGKFIATGTKKGTFDLSATVHSRSVKLETKHNTDKPSPEQIKMQARERRAGAIAEFIWSIDDFFEVYDSIIEGTYVERGVERPVSCGIVKI